MTEALPWVKWRFDKWRNEACLRMCSLAARGLWIDLLSLMHEATPYGHLTVNGRAPSSKQIASLVGMTTEKEVSALLIELDDAGVFSRTPEGVIFSRRMVRDKAASDLGKQTGSTGGNPVLIGRPKKKVNGGGYPSSQQLPLTDGVNPPRNPREDKIREEERREDSELRSGATRPIRDQLWAEGVPIIRDLTGLPDGKARSLLGGLLKRAEDDCPRVLLAIREAGNMRPADPQAWLMRAVQPRPEQPRMTGGF